MWYKRGHENPHFSPTIHPGRTAPDPGRIALVRCLHLAPLPDLAGFCPWGTRPKDCPPTRLRRPDRSQCDPWFQCWRSERAGRRLLTPPSTANHLLGRSSPATTGNLASSSAGVWQRERPVDLGTGRPGQFRARLTTTLVSDESVRRVFKRLKINWKRAKHWITSPDPLYLQKKPHATV